MKYAVRYEVEGFVVKEVFESYEQAESFYDETIEKMDKWLITIDLYEI